MDEEFDILSKQLYRHGLTVKEVEMANLACEGLSAVEMAEKAGRSIKTIKFHLTNIYIKLDVTSRPKMMRKCYNWVLSESRV